MVALIAPLPGLKISEKVNPHAPHVAAFKAYVVQERLQDEQHRHDDSSQGVLAKHQADLLADWVREQVAAVGSDTGRLKESELRDQCREFLDLLQAAAEAGRWMTSGRPRWNGVREMLANLSRSRALQGFSPSETRRFVFSFKKPLFARLRRELDRRRQALAEETWAATELLDKLGLYTTEVHKKSREEVIGRQQQEMLELSTPVVKLWEGILALPMIGTLDSARTQIVMEIAPPEDRRDGLGHRHHRHHGRADRGHPHGPAPAEDGDRRPADGGRVHHQRHPPPDRPDDRPPGRRPRRGSRPRPPWPTPSPSPWSGPAAAVQRIVRATGRHEGAPVERIPILRMGDFLLVTIQVDMHDRLVTTLQDDLTTKIAEQRLPTGVLIDISSLDMVDSFIGRMIGNIAGMARILDAETVVVGMQPAVAITLVELGLSLEGVRTAWTSRRGWTS